MLTVVEYRHFLVPAFTLLQEFSVCQSTELFLKSSLEGYCTACCFNYAFQLTVPVFI